MKELKYAYSKVQNRIAYISINRPEKRNALNDEVVRDLLELFTEAEFNENVKVIVLKGEGEAFCAGADLAYLKQLQQNTFEENLEDSLLLKSLFEKIYTLKKVVIAQIEGHAIAGGAGLATVCDFVFSVPDAKLGFTEVKIGFVPAIISMFIVRKIGETKSKELLLTGELITANKAKAIGLINYISELDQIEEDVISFANNLIKNCSSDSLSLSKQLLADISSKPYEDALNYAASLNAKARTTNDCKKGITAFLNKEQIEW
jgi:methylglutaconyl-CoA hydratase